MTLTKRYEDLEHVPGQREWILLKSVCAQVDAFKAEFEIMDRILHRVAEATYKNLNRPTYGPMLEEDDQS